MTTYRTNLSTVACLLIAAALAACGGATVESVCAKCENNDADCVAEGTEFQKKVEKAGCGDQFQEYLDCLDDKATCSGEGKLEGKACESLEETVEKCE